MNATNPDNRSKTNDPSRNGSRAKSGSKAPRATSRYEKFAATQASADGIQGDAKKCAKTVEDKIAANMADRK
jgi:hypothetical protein